MRNRRHPATASILIALALLAGCSGDDEESQPTATGADPGTTETQDPGDGTGSGPQTAPPNTIPATLSTGRASDVEVEKVGPPGGSGAATALRATAGCSSADLTKGVASLRWKPAADAGSEQRVAMTVYPDGFRQGVFDLSLALSPDQDTLVWTRLQGEAIHSWLVLTLHGDRWTPSRAASFEGPTCAVDAQPTPTNP